MYWLTSSSTVSNHTSTTWGNTPTSNRQLCWFSSRKNPCTTPWIWLSSSTTVKSTRQTKNWRICQTLVFGDIGDSYVSYAAGDSKLRMTYEVYDGTAIIQNKQWWWLIDLSVGAKFESFVSLKVAIVNYILFNFTSEVHALLIRTGNITPARTLVRQMVTWPYVTKLSRNMPYQQNSNFCVRWSCRMDN